MTFLAMGELAEILQARMLPVFKPVAAALLAVFRQKLRVRQAFFPEAYQCIRMVAKGLGEAVAADLRQIIGLPFLSSSSALPHPSPQLLSSIKPKSPPSSSTA